MTTLEYIQNPELIENIISDKNVWWDEEKKCYIEHIQNQYKNLISFCEKYPYRYDETLDVLALLLELLREDSRIIGIFRYAHTNPHLWVEQWKRAK